MNRWISLHFSDSFSWGLKTTLWHCDKKKKIPNHLLLRETVFRSWKKTTVYTSHARENKLSLERYLLGFCDFKENMPSVYLWEAMVFPFLEWNICLIQCRVKMLWRKKQNVHLSLKKWEQCACIHNKNFSFGILHFRLLLFHIQFPC